MAQQASLNNIPVSALVSRFTVEPSVQQRFENAVKESTEFTKKINVFGVTDQKGEKILLDTTGPIARTNTSYDGTKRRNPNNVVDLKNRKYQCEQVNYDTFISYPQLDAWAAHPDFQSRVSTQIARQVALDRIMIGFNGTSHADESNFSTNKLLQDVNVGWLEHIRTDASERVMNDVTLTSRNMDNTVAHAGKYANADALVREAEEKKARLIQEATDNIAILQDAVNLEIATNEENSQLDSWRKYRVLVSRIDTSTAPDIVWPELMNQGYVREDEQITSD
ncbi:P2 family phage major capsid protein [Escherichia coli]|uniref:P2 family phage major capsid protein n=6 Tax=Escherichia coli TaxID=562 RepID=UPI00358DAF9A